MYIYRHIYIYISLSNEQQSVDAFDCERRPPQQDFHFDYLLVSCADLSFWSLTEILTTRIISNSNHKWNQRINKMFAKTSRTEQFGPTHPARQLVRHLNGLDHYHYLRLICSNANGNNKSMKNRIHFAQDTQTIVETQLRTFQQTVDNLTGKCNNNNDHNRGGKRGAFTEQLYISVLFIHYIACAFIGITIGRFLYGQSPEFQIKTTMPPTN